MEPPRRIQTSLGMEVFAFGELVYHTVVREVRTASGSATLGLLSAIGQTIAMVAIFYVMYAFLGLRSAIIRGDMVLFILSGVLLFLLHNSTISKTIKAGSATSPMMLHAPMTPPLMILSATIATLYLFALSAVIILFGLYLVRGHLDIQDAGGMLLPFFLSWASGLVVGLGFLVIQPFAPKLMQTVSMLYRRANMFTSGKFFLANMLPAATMPYFAWNPLFHCIDQMRGAIFVNYFPHRTSMAYPVWFVFAGLVIGLMFEFWLRRTVSRSTTSTN